MSFKTILHMPLVLALSSCAMSKEEWGDYVRAAVEMDRGYTAHQARNGGQAPNAPGPGVHLNQYGQPVTLQVQNGGIPGEPLQIKPNAYGPGVHMDQYGRQVRERPYP